MNNKLIISTYYFANSLGLGDAVTLIASIKICASIKIGARFTGAFPEQIGRQFADDNFLSVF